MAVFWRTLLPPAAILSGQWAELPTAPARGTFAIGWLACLAGVLFACRTVQPGRVAMAVGLVASLSMAYVFGVALPALEPYRGERPFAQAVREGHPLSESERWMLSFSESDPEFVFDPSRNAAFAAEISDIDYEKKVAGLAVRAYAAEREQKGSRCAGAPGPAGIPQGAHRG